MINDLTLMFSSAQAVTASAASTNVIDLGATGAPYAPYGTTSTPLVRDLGRAPDLNLAIDVVQSFAGITSLQVSVQTSPDAATWTTVDSGPVVAASSLVTGYQFKSPAVLPEGTNQRYVRLYYTVAGGPGTTGAITAAVIASRQTNLSWGAQ